MEEDKLKKIQEIRKRVHETSIYIGDVTKEVKTRFKELAEAEFKNHYGWTLKWLLDFRDGLLSSPNEELTAKIDILADEINQIRDELNKIKSEEKKPEKAIKTLSGRKLKKKMEG
jgi:predicted  nucleic acid-binding Zn-ribbon protein